MSNFIIIDKSPNNVKTLTNFLEQFTKFNSLGVVNMYDEALEMCLQYSPNLIFLNLDDTLNQPLYFLKELQQLITLDSLVIVISKHKEKAYEAIKNGMVDLLLLPLKELDMRISVLKAEKVLDNKRNSTICLQSYKDFRYLNTDEILFLKADNNTTDFYMKDQSVVNAYKTLKTFESRLPKEFIRIHKSYIINSNHISRINFGKLQYSFRQYDSDIPFTKTYINQIKNLNMRLSNQYENALN